ADSRALLRRLLEPLGFVVMEATRGDTCLDAVRAAPPDVLLLDISMPGLNGWEVARRLRASGLQELPIVMVSADAFENRQNR
ncbi:response regulator, partial [Acinetobacter baumannii]